MWEFDLSLWTPSPWDRNGVSRTIFLNNNGFGCGGSSIAPRVFRGNLTNSRGSSLPPYAAWLALFGGPAY